jgi:rSAM/selenodomain-associated transferase 2/rSAM/selenodomain-associated transferase 1
MKQAIPHILIFARYPEPGRAKTRLIPTLTPLGAARLHRRMTEHVLGAARAFQRARGCRADVKITICHTGARQKDFRAWLGTDLDFAEQVHGDIGARMLGAFKTAFQKKAEPVIGIGSDVPGTTLEILQQATESLRYKDIVLGRAEDGGYYLIGMKSLYPGLFEGIDWGTGRVYEQTCGNIHRLGLALAEMPPLRDVDRPDDLAAVRDDPYFSDIFSNKSLISIIIPTLNEATTIGPLLNYLGRSEEIERIVVDGGSRDQTRDIAARKGAKVLKVPGGRALQQNAGAAVARGRILLFLHADTLPPEGYVDRICAALNRPSTVAGAFRFKTDDSRAIMRLVEWVTSIRSTIFQMPYGDQGIFMEKRVFDEMGGFLPLPIMEDFDLIRRLSSRGRIVTLSDAAITSARRWQRLGVIRTTLVNQIMIVGFLAGIPISRLHRLYQITGNRVT